MEVVVAGAGSIGLLIGSFLAETGMNVTFYVRRLEQATVIRKEGIHRLNGDGTTRVFQADATTDIHGLPPGALWIIAVKYSGLHALLDEMTAAQVVEPILFVQNGIGHLELAYSTDIPHIAFATVEHGALRLDDHTVSHNGVGKLIIARGRGDVGRFESLQLADGEFFPVAFAEDVEQILMRKVLMNCMINPLTAILQVENGKLVEDTACHNLFKQLYAELMVAFPGMQSALPIEAVTDLCNRTARNRSSMLADRLAGRSMEIETIVTAVIRKAERIGMPLPLLTTLEQLLKAIDGKGDK